VTVEKAAKAGAWSAIDMLVRQGVGFLVLIVLARLLMPADFGIVALVTFFSSLSIVFVQGGLSQALIQRQRTTHDEESAVFWWNLGGSAILAVLLVLIAPFLARFYGHPVLAPLMLVAAAQVVFAALGAVQTALLTRALRFDRLTMAGLVASIASGGVGIGVALMGGGAWALALQLASLAAVNSLILWLVSDWRPVMHFRFATIRPLFDFGIYLSLSSLLDVVYTQGFALIIGKLHGVRELGLYNRASSTQLLPSNVLGSMIARIALPLFSQRTADGEGLRRGMRMANSLAMILNVPAMLGLALLPDLVISTLFGDKWLPAAPILTVLAIGGIILPLHIINLQLLLAHADSKRFFRIELTKKVGGIIFVIVGSYFGIMGLAWATMLFSLVAFPINAAPTRGSLGYSPLAQLWDLRGLVIPAAAMSAVLYFVKPLLPFGPPVSLLILAAAGAILYFAIGFGLRLRSFREAWQVGLAVLRRGSPLAA
jgi:O-antigen/teichoic acid export membrane protein